MGESTCLMHSFSYSATPSSSQQLRDPLSGSISFGRFMSDSSSDSFSWDKWSNLSHKRYVEEAAKYSQPGSVAQKKAFFEEYYKKKALLAKENAAAARIAQDQQLNHDANDDTYETTYSAQLDVLANVTEMPNEGVDMDVRTDDASITIPRVSPEVIIKHNVTPATEHNVGQLASLTHVDAVCQPKVLKADPDLSTATTEVSEDSEMEKPLLKDRNANQEVTSSMRKPRLPPVPSLKPAASLWPSAKTPCPLPKSVNRSRKENETPTNTILGMESLEKIKMSPKPLFSYMSRTPSRDANSCTVNSLKGANESMQATRTPTVAPKTKKLTITPKSENRRNMTPLESATPGNRTKGVNWSYFRGLDFSMCLSATCRNKSRPSPTAASPFNFRTEERAVKRKEKLELKFNEKTPQKVQLQTKLKEKAECELKKLRQSLCFHARPLPSFYKERNPQKDNIISTNEAEAPGPSKLQLTKRIRKDVCKGLTSPAPPKTQRPYSSHKSKSVTVSTTRKSATKGLTHPRSLASIISNEHFSPALLPSK